MSDPGDKRVQVTRVIEAMARGEAGRGQELLELVYGELRQMAAAAMAREKPGRTLQPTALVHEANGANSATLQVVQGCYANCDHSVTPPVLNVLDFSCFLNRFSNGDPSANCDGSTVSPVLNVQDFACFLNAFSVGCGN